MTSSFRHTLRGRHVSICLAAGLALVGLNLAFFCPHAQAASAAECGGQSVESPSSSSPAAPPARPAARRPARTAAHLPAVPSPLAVKSKIALVEDANSSEVLLAKNADKVTPIASITKLMTAIVVLDAGLPLEDVLTISDEDRDGVMGTTSRLNIGWSLSRADMLHVALMSSENRAAAALSRYYPGGRPAFIAAMNARAAELGMSNTHFVNPNGLTSENVSTAFDLVKLVQAADQYPLIREFSTDRDYAVRVGRHILQFVNSDRLVRSSDWDIEIQKTGFINESGHCVVMRLNTEGRALIMIFLDGYGKLTRYADARRVLTQLAVAQHK